MSSSDEVRIIEETKKSRKVLKKTASGKLMRTLASMLVLPDQEEIDNRKQVLKHKDLFKDFKHLIKCTKCGVAFDSLVKEGKELLVHPILKVLYCQKCCTYYGDGEFSLDEDDEDKYCRWCGEGGKLFLCSKCICGFCPKCIRKHLGAESLQAVENDDNWKCLICEPTPLWHLRHVAHLARKVAKGNRKNLKEEREQRLKLLSNKDKPGPKSKKRIVDEEEKRDLKVKWPGKGTTNEKAEEPASKTRRPGPKSKTITLSDDESKSDKTKIQSGGSDKEMKPRRPGPKSKTGTVSEDEHKLAPKRKTRAQSESVQVAKKANEPNTKRVMPLRNQSTDSKTRETTKTLTKKKPAKTAGAKRGQTKASTSVVSKASKRTRDSSAESHSQSEKRKRRPKQDSSDEEMLRRSRKSRRDASSSDESDYDYKRKRRRFRRQRPSSDEDSDYQRRRSRKRARRSSSIDSEYGRRRSRRSKRDEYSDDSDRERRRRRRSRSLDRSGRRKRDESTDGDDESDYGGRRIAKKADEDDQPDLSPRLGNKIRTTQKQLMGIKSVMESCTQSTSRLLKRTRSVKCEASHAEIQDRIVKLIDCLRGVVTRSEAATKGDAEEVSIESVKPSTDVRILDEFVNLAKEAEVAVVGETIADAKADDVEIVGTKASPSKRSPDEDVGVTSTSDIQARKIPALNLDKDTVVNGDGAVGDVGINKILLDINLSLKENNMDAVDWGDDEKQTATVSLTVINKSDKMESAEAIDEENTNGNGPESDEAVAKDCERQDQDNESQDDGISNVKEVECQDNDKDKENLESDVEKNNEEDDNNSAKNDKEDEDSQISEKKGDENGENSGDDGQNGGDMSQDGEDQDDGDSGEESKNPDGSDSGQDGRNENNASDNENDEVEDASNEDIESSRDQDDKKKNEDEEARKRVLKTSSDDSDDITSAATPDSDERTSRRRKKKVVHRRQAKVLDPKKGGQKKKRDVIDALTDLKSLRRSGRKAESEDTLHDDTTVLSTDDEVKIIKKERAAKPKNPEVKKTFFEKMESIYSSSSDAGDNDKSGNDGDDKPKDWMKSICKNAQTMLKDLVLETSASDDYSDAEDEKDMKHVSKTYKEKVKAKREGGETSARKKNRAMSDDEKEINKMLKGLSSDDSTGGLEKSVKHKKSRKQDTDDDFGCDSSKNVSDETSKKSKKQCSEVSSKENYNSDGSTGNIKKSDKHNPISSESHNCDNNDKTDRKNKQKLNSSDNDDSDSSRTNKKSKKRARRELSGNEDSEGSNSKQSRKLKRRGSDASTTEKVTSDSDDKTKNAKNNKNNSGSENAQDSDDSISYLEKKIKYDDKRKAMKEKVLDSTSSSDENFQRKRSKLGVGSDSSSEVEVIAKRKASAIDSDSSGSIIGRKEKKEKVVLDSDSEFSVKLDDDDDSSASDVEVIKCKRATRRRKDISSEDTDSKSKKNYKRIAAGSSNSDSDVEVVEGKSPVKGRKNIRGLMKKDKLEVETKQAVKAETERRGRIAKRYKDFKKLFSEESNRIILDFDEKGEVLVEVASRLVKKLKPHQKEGVRFMWDNCFESLKAMETSNGGGCILAHCMGLGKTLQVITLLHTVLTGDMGVETALVVCPLNTVANWANEIEMWMRVARCDLIDVYDLNKYKSIAERRYQVKSWLREGGIMIISYSMFRNLTNSKSKKKCVEALVRPGPDIVICDEGHLLKNENTALSKAVSQIQTCRRVVLTGTPLQNNLKEYHCMVQFIKPNILGTKYEFCNRFVNPIENGQFEDSTARDVEIMKRRSHVLHTMLSGCIQRQDYGVLTPFLPPKLEYVLAIALSAPLEQLYRHYIDNLSRRSAGSRATSSLFADYQALQRIWTHPLTMMAQLEKNNERKLKETENLDEYESDFIDDGDETSDASNDDDFSSSKKKKKRRPGTRATPRDSPPPGTPPPATTEKPWWEGLISEEMQEDERASTKLTVFFSIVRECEERGDKLLVFSQSLFTLDLIEHFLYKKNEAGERWQLGVNYFRLDGGSSSDKRAEWCKKFNREGNTAAKLFLISTKAGGLGINLVGANRVVIFDASWNPSHDLQSIFRIYRFGQSKPCYVYRLLAEATMEEKIYERQVTKLSLAHRVVDEHQIERHYTMGNLQELYRFEPLPKDKWKTPIVPKDDLLAKILKNHEDVITSYHEHDSLLENKQEEELSEEERKKAWEEYEVAQNPPPPPLVNNYISYQQNMQEHQNQNNAFFMQTYQMMLTKIFGPNYELNRDPNKGPLHMPINGTPTQMQQWRQAINIMNPYMSMLNPASRMQFPMTGPVRGTAPQNAAGPARGYPLQNAGATLGNFAAPNGSGQAQNRPFGAPNPAASNMSKMLNARMPKLANKSQAKAANNVQTKQGVESEAASPRGVALRQLLAMDDPLLRNLHEKSSQPKLMANPFAKEAPAKPQKQADAVDKMLIGMGPDQLMAIGVEHSLLPREGENIGRYRERLGEFLRANQEEVVLD